MPDYGGEWFWDDETEQCMLTLLARSPRARIAIDLTKSTQWLARRTMELLPDSKIDRVAAAAAYHMAGIR